MGVGVTTRSPHVEGCKARAIGRKRVVYPVNGGFCHVDGEGVGGFTTASDGSSAQASVLRRLPSKPQNGGLAKQCLTEPMRLNPTHVFQSLRFRMLLPLLGASLIAALLVAAASLKLGERWARADVQERFEGIEQTICESSFPLTSAVLDSIGGLTAAELVAMDAQRQVVSTTLAVSRGSFDRLADELYAIGKERGTSMENSAVSVAGRAFFSFEFERPQRRAVNDNVTNVAVLFDRARIDAAAYRAAWLPLATGLSTVLLLTAISVFVSRRLVARMIRLQERVQRVAAGDFHSQVGDASTDELGQLGRSVDSMARQLDQLWTQVHRQQSEKTLYQLASGMAHQLRNTLTGSRMAMELHRRDCRSDDAEDVGIAIRQLEIAEDYVQRLLHVGAGLRREPRPGSLVQCLTDLKSSHTAIAKHLNVDLAFDVEDRLSPWWVDDASALTSAIANLLMNAMQAATWVRVCASLDTADGSDDDAACQISVTDNGDGIDSQLSERIFEPLVTSKPEGMGLGLAVVRQAAESLSGSVNWHRSEGKTIFVFRCLLIHPAETKAAPHPSAMTSDKGRSE